ncbi:hypothetical protein MC7420_214 [Coleofasciculus chthonoplastes PCC 7420]|uniref:Uncharacterized protein n=1 Tax=Coleofasciculus chthonoplastes PCC 7420 TaxID=118168 RepID=B4VLM0_9CYAN|nr:hypothetical protein MC7420_214 [Coleofasciculus chthonoplastes PCC 7420]
MLTSIKLLLFPVPCSLFPVPCSLFPVPSSQPLTFIFPTYLLMIHCSRGK